MRVSLVHMGYLPTAPTEQAPTRQSDIGMAATMQAIQIRATAATSKTRTLQQRIHDQELRRTIELLNHRHRPPAPYFYERQRRPRRLGPDEARGWRPRPGAVAGLVTLIAPALAVALVVVAAAPAT